MKTEARGLRAGFAGVAAATIMLSGCSELFVELGPAAPRELDAWYYARAVHIEWELAPAWDGDYFRVYGKRSSDEEYFLVAEVTNCLDGYCSYTDINIAPQTTYDYYVASVDPDDGVETESDYTVEVFVPEPVPPPAPSGLEVVALDDATYLLWDDEAREADDFSFYRLYVVDDDGEILFGETDSEGFLDLLAENGVTYSYMVTAVDDAGHESGGSGLASGTPRPDYHGEWLYAYQDRPEYSGFRFRDSGDSSPIVDGSSPARHFRLEVDAEGWWLVPGPAAEIYPDGFETTELKCGAGSEADCVSLDVAPGSGYTSDDVGISPQMSYALRVVESDGSLHYGVIRVEYLGTDQDADALMIFDWAYQLQEDNRNLSPVAF